MAQLIVRNLEESLVKELRLRAAKKGRSAEAEHRAILREALSGRKRTETIKQALLGIPAVGDDSDFERPRGRGRKVRL
jgi:plasmid stability protein